MDEIKLEDEAEGVEEQLSLVLDHIRQIEINLADIEDRLERYESKMSL